MSDRAPTIPRWSVAASTATVALAAVASLAGLLTDVYDDPAVLLPQLYGQDAVTLLVAVPTLVVSLRAARHGSLRAYVVWLGVTGYVLYTYATYAFMTVFNELYLVYVALLALSLYTFIDGFRRVDPAALERAVAPVGTSPYVAFQVFLVVLVGSLWLAEVVPATLTGTTPASATEAGLPVNVIHSLDFGVILPAFAISAHWLHRGRAWGYATTAVLLVKAATLAGAVLAMAVVMTLDGQIVPVAQYVIFGALAVASTGLLARLLLAVRTRSPSSVTGT